MKFRFLSFCNHKKIILFMYIYASVRKTRMEQSHSLLDRETHSIFVMRGDHNSYFLGIESLVLILFHPPQTLHECPVIRLSRRLIRGIRRIRITHSCRSRSFLNKNSLVNKNSLSLIDFIRKI